MGDRMKYTTLLVDADETLFDFRKCEANALKNALTFYGLEYNEDINKKFTSINSALWRKFEMSRITRSELRVRRFSELIEKCFDGFTDAEKLAFKYIDELSYQAILIPGTAGAVKKLSELYDIYIITNGLTKVQRGRFSRTEITGYFKDIFISDEIGMNKPDKKFFDYVLSKIDEKDRSKILVVGDSLTSDMQGGRNAGLDTCLFDPYDNVSMPHPLCDHKIKSLAEIISFASEEEK